jgi:hypothetical protein
MSSAPAWHRFVRLLLACAALGAAVAPDRARAEYAEIDGAPALTQSLAAAPGLQARVRRLRAATTAARARALAARRFRPRIVPRRSLVASRLYVFKRSFLL